MATIKMYLRNRVYSSFFFSNLIEVLGTSLFNIVLMIYAGTMPIKEYQGWAITLVGMANLLPGLLQVITGFLADRNQYPIIASRIIKIAQGILYLFLTLIFDKPFTWIIFLIIVIVNIVSDTLGNYSGSVLIPVMKDIVDDDDREKMTGFGSGINQILTLIGQLMGSVMIVWMSYNYANFSFLNSLLFFTSAGIMFFGLGTKKTYNKLLTIPHKEKSVGIEKNDSKKFNDRFLVSLKDIFSVPLLGWYISLYTVSGLVGAAISEVAILAILRYPATQFINFGFSISALNITFACGNILGSILTIPYVVKKSVATLFVLQSFGILLVATSFILQIPFYIICSFLFISAVLQGTAAPKLSAWIMNNGINEHLAFSLSVISSAMTITLPVGQLIFMSIANIWSVRLSLYSISVYLIGVIIYGLYVKHREKLRK